MFFFYIRIISFCFRRCIPIFRIWCYEILCYEIWPYVILYNEIYIENTFLAILYYEQQIELIKTGPVESDIITDSILYILNYAFLYWENGSHFRSNCQFECYCWYHTYQYLTIIWSSLQFYTVWFKLHVVVIDIGVSCAIFNYDVISENN